MKIKIVEITNKNNKNKSNLEEEPIIAIFIVSLNNPLNLSKIYIKRNEKCKLKLEDAEIN